MFRHLQIFLDSLIDLLKWPAAALMLLLTYPAFEALKIYIASYTHMADLLAFGAGMAAYAAVFFVIMRGEHSFLSTAEHELTHLLFAVLTFHKPVDLDIGTRSNGGYVAFKGKGNWLITITPYFFPLFAVILMFLFPFFKGTRSMATSFDAVFGFFVCYHFLSVFQELHPQQTDLHKAGPAFCLCFLPGANLITAGLLLGFANMQGKGMTTFINLLYRRAISSYDALLRLTETFF